MKSERPVKPPMKSAIVRRKMRVNRRMTSVCLENDFSNALIEIAANERVSASELVSMIDRQQHDNLSSAIRLFVLDHYRAECARRKAVLATDITTSLSS
jgi:predicted DNA-binding ribbon-helix-helix protein